MKSDRVNYCFLYDWMLQSGRHKLTSACWWWVTCTSCWFEWCGWQFIVCWCVYILHVTVALCIILLSVSVALFAPVIWSLYAIVVFGSVIPDKKFVVWLWRLVSAFKLSMAVWLIDVKNVISFGRLVVKSVCSHKLFTSLQLRRACVMTLLYGKNSEYWQISGELLFNSSSNSDIRSGVVGKFVIVSEPLAIGAVDALPYCLFNDVWSAVWKVWYVLDGFGGNRVSFGNSLADAAPSATTTASVNNSVDVSGVSDIDSVGNRSVVESISGSKISISFCDVELATIDVEAMGICCRSWSVVLSHSLIHFTLFMQLFVLFEHDPSDEALHGPHAPQSPRVVDFALFAVAFITIGPKLFNASSLVRPSPLSTVVSTVRANVEIGCLASMQRVLLRLSTAYSVISSGVPSCQQFSLPLSDKLRDIFLARRRLIDTVDVMVVVVDVFRVDCDRLFGFSLAATLRLPKRLTFARILLFLHLVGDWRASTFWLALLRCTPFRPVEAVAFNFFNVDGSLMILRRFSDDFDVEWLLRLGRFSLRSHIMAAQSVCDSLLCTRNSRMEWKQKVIYTNRWKRHLHKYRRMTKGATAPSATSQFLQNKNQYERLRSHTRPSVHPSIISINWDVAFVREN